jgi:hypothetical protein
MISTNTLPKAKEPTLRPFKALTTTNTPAGKSPYEDDPAKPRKPARKVNGKMLTDAMLRKPEPVAEPEKKKGGKKGK